MPTESDIAAAPSARSVAIRFWLLLAAILLLTIGSATATLRGVAFPFLEEYQTRVLENQGEIKAQQLDARLARNGLIMDLIARDPNVINFVIGYSENTYYFADHLDTLPLSEDLSWVTVYDVFGAPIAEYDVRKDDRAVFDADALHAFAGAALVATQAGRSNVLLENIGDQSHFVTATAISQNGFVEGVLLAGYRLELGEIFPEGDIVAETVLLQDTGARPDAGEGLLAPLESLTLSLLIIPDLTALYAAGNRFIAFGMLAVAAVLLGSFGIFAFLSKSVIIAPHSKLHAQAKRLAEQKRELTELAAVAARANDAVLVTDLAGDITWANPAFEKLTGYALADIIGRKPGGLLQSIDTDPDTILKLRAALAAREPVQVEILNRKREGAQYWINLSISPLTNDSGETYGFVAISNDITKAREAREALLAAKKEIERQSLHDPLTGLFNRRALERELSGQLGAERRSTILIRIDLDHFKHVNDTLGHEAGDYVLVQVARILEKETKADDLAVRVGGDEFVILMADGSSEHGALSLAQRILSRIRAPKYFHGRTIRIGASFGIAALGDDIKDPNDLFVAADAALYQAKDAGRNRVHLYTPALHQEVIARRDLSKELRAGIAKSEFEPYFQPQIDAITGELTGLEVLARWHSRSIGIITPDLFLPLAAQLSVVEEIDLQIFQKATEQILALCAEDMHIPKISFNVTAQQIKDKTIVDKVRSLPTTAPSIAFEILESVLIEEQSPCFQRGLDLLRGNGVQIEIDDFGSGHASIVGLMQLRPDTMKIDRKLVQSIVKDPLARGMLSRIVDIAELMELSVIAEGVETAQHADILRDIGCHSLQGFHFGRPMPIDGLRSFLRATTEHPGKRGYPRAVS